MQRTYPDNYFLVIYFHHYLVDSVSAYYVEKKEQTFGIYSKMIELDRSPHEDDKPVLEKEITAEEYHSFVFMYAFCLKQAERSGGFKERGLLPSPFFLQRIHMDFWMQIPQGQTLYVH